MKILETIAKLFALFLGYKLVYLTLTSLNPHKPWESLFMITLTTLIIGVCGAEYLGKAHE